MDGDGDRDILDLLRLLLAVRFGTENTWAADVDYNGQVEAGDLTTLIGEM